MKSASYDKSLSALDASIASAPAVVLTRGSALKIEPIRWLWKNWLAKGKFHLLAGAAGQGKTTLALAMAATVTMGGRWPDGSACQQGNVLIWSGEDDPADTLAPRLLAAGANLDHCYFVSGTQINGEVQPFDPARDLTLINDCLSEIGGASLLIVDPVVSAVTGDSHKNTETRRALQPLVDLAATCGCAVLGITHFSKGGQGSDPASRVVGSIAFTALARVVIVAAKVQSEDGSDTRVMARAKSNIGPDEGGYEYHLEQMEVATDIFASAVAWGKAVEGSARDLLTDPNSDEATETMDAVSIMREMLTADCWTPQKTVAAAMRVHGYSPKQTRSACNKLGVISKKASFKGEWYWRLPGGPNPEFPSEDTSEDAQQEKQGILGILGGKRASLNDTTTHEGMQVASIVYDESMQDAQDAQDAPFLERAPSDAFNAYLAASRGH